MNTENNPEEFYNKLRGRLEETATWPSEYLFKFIVPSEKEKIKSLEDLFDNTGAVIDTKESRKGTYTSVSVNVRMKDPDAVIKKYQQAAVVEGVISL
ncbi:MAG: DUF493 family protein [Leeuwenhoekiella sp.]